MLSSTPLIRTVSSPALIKQEIVMDQTRTMSLDGIDIDEEDIFSQWKEDASNAQTSPNKIDSKSIWKQIFSKSSKEKSPDDDLKAQWTDLDKDPSSDHNRFNKLPAGVKRTCPFYKKIPGNTNDL